MYRSDSSFKQGKKENKMEGWGKLKMKEITNKKVNRVSMIISWTTVMSAVFPITVAACTELRDTRYVYCTTVLAYLYLFDIT